MENIHSLIEIIQKKMMEYNEELENYEMNHDEEEAEMV